MTIITEEYQRGRNEEWERWAPLVTNYLTLLKDIHARQATKGQLGVAFMVALELQLLMKERPFPDGPEGNEAGEWAPVVNEFIEVADQIIDESGVAKDFDWGRYDDLKARLLAMAGE